VLDERFADRAAAGRALAERLLHLRADDPVVAGLPRGGVVVAARVAEALRAPLAAVVARKIRTPGHAELAMGAVAVWDDHVADVRLDYVLEGAGISDAQFHAERDAELAVARERAADFAGRLPVGGRTVIVVDDGLATGATMRAALAVLRTAGAGRLVAAVPVGVPAELDTLGTEVVTVTAPQRFGAVGAHYRDFSQIDDATVVAELRRARRI
jgi:putative phosphoribosyl transferase